MADPRTPKLLALKKRFEKLSPGDKLRVAAGCLDQGKYEIAETLADELRVLRLLRGR